MLYWTSKGQGRWWEVLLYNKFILGDTKMISSIQLTPDRSTDREVLKVSYK